MADPNPTKADDPLSLHYGSAQPGEGVLLTPAQKAAAGPQPEPTMVTMDVLRDGSYAGEYRHAGDSVDVPEDTVETLTLSGFAARADRAARSQQARDAKQARVDAQQDLAAKRKGGPKSTAVAPLTTHDMPGAEPPKTE